MPTSTVRPRSWWEPIAPFPSGGPDVQVVSVGDTEVVVDFLGELVQWPLERLLTLYKPSPENP